jgi:integrase
MMAKKTDSKGAESPLAAKDKGGRPKRKRGNSQGTIRERKSGNFEWAITLGFSHQTGGQTRLYGTGRTKTDAAAKMAEAIADHKRGGVASPDRVTVKEWLENWLNGRAAKLKPSTVASYSGLIRLHIAPAIGTLRLQALRPLDLRDFYTRLAVQGLSPRTIRYVHGVIFSALKNALQLELVVRNVADAAKPEVTAVDRNAKAATAWTAEEATLFLAAARQDRLYCAFYLMLGLGLRRGEVPGLRWAYVDLEAGRLKVEETLGLVNGKPTPGGGKNYNARRTVPLPAETVAALVEHRQRQRQELEASGLVPASDWVFLSQAATTLDPNNLKRVLERIAKVAGVRAVRIHDLRHSHASLARRYGTPLEVVSERLGHSRASFTADVYRHTYQDEREAHAIGLSDLLAAKAKPEKE